MVADPAGPFVALAVLCDRIEPKPDGTVDVHGIVDGVVITPEEEEEGDPLGLRPAARLSLTAVVSLKAGDRRGTYQVGLQGIYPSGAPGPTATRPVEFTDDMPGASFVVPLELEVHEPGVYAFDVTWDGALVSRITLQVYYAQ
jgi:hypothetical protein